MPVNRTLSDVRRNGLPRAYPDAEPIRASHGQVYPGGINELHQVDFFGFSAHGDFHRAGEGVAGGRQHAVYSGSTLLGYVSDTYPSLLDASGITPSTSGALSVQINTAATSPFSILVLNPPGSNSYFGATGGVADYLASGQLAYSFLTGTSLVAAGSKPSSSATNDIYGGGFAGNSESTIWSLSGDVLTAQWVNSDGTMNPTTLYYDQGDGYLGVTGDLSVFQSTFFAEGAEAVTLEFTGNVASPTPEPSSFALFGTGLACALGLARRRLLQPAA